MRQPDYERGNVNLYCGDCMDIMREMPDDSVDIVVTSPPYNIDGGNHKPSGMFSHDRCGPLNISKDWYEDAMPEDEYWVWLNTVVSECRRVASGLVWINHKVRYAEREAIHPVRLINQPCYSEVIWDRGGLSR